MKNSSAIGLANLSKLQVEEEESFENFKVAASILVKF